MAFNTGLSGLRAASVDLDVTGNNIANASTVGFKGSKAQFGDLYASGFLSAGTTPIGDGVKVQDVKQSFGQGNISFTDNGLDLAIDGDGFFILNNGGEIRYSRAGQFQIDKEGYVINNQNMRVQGYTADEDGNLSGIRGDLQIATDNLAPRRTTSLQTDVNLDSREEVLERRVRNLGELDMDGANTVDSETFTITYNDDTPDESVSIPAGATARQAAAEISEATGFSASATTTATLTGMTDADVTPGFNFELSIGTGQIQVDTDGINTLSELRDRINATDENTILATINSAGDLEITQNQGENITYNYPGIPGGNPVTERGTVIPVADRNIESVTGTSTTTNFADAFDNGNIQVTNAFNPIDQRTYNHATSTTIYDSLGNSHEMTQFYVKEPSPGNGVGQSEWSIYLQIDGEYVGNTDINPYTARFNEDGSLASINGDTNGEIIITDWTPKDPAGDPNGADGPPADPGSVVSPIPEPPSSSAFVLDLGETTQYGSTFGVNDQQQNGYTTGRLSGLDVSDEGVLFARYTNGQSQELGQVALAGFQNTDGLSPVGETSWVETFESGQPIIGAPDTGTLGSIKASSVEESNVDLSAELVNLIIAQRNYQANAKTIETSDAVTQTIINLR